MEIVRDQVALRSHDGGLVCALAEREDDPVAIEAAQAFGLVLPSSEPRPHRRPSAHVQDGRVSLVLMVLGEDRGQSPLRVYANDRGMIAVGSPDAGRVVTEALRPEVDDVWSAVVAVVMATARRCEVALEQIEDDAQELQDAAT